MALIIGDDDYKLIRSLDNAVADAQAVGETLEKLGFEVILETNRDLRRTRRALEDFRKDAAGADVALVYFAGHGVEIAGENRLLPTDADASSLQALTDSSLTLEEVRETVAAVSKVGLIILDACRNDPFGVAGSNSIGDGSERSAVTLTKDVTEAVRPGLGRVGRAEGTLFAFSAAPGETASDGADGHSPFAAALAKYLGTDGLEIRSVLTLVQQEVYDFSSGKQLPYVESGLPELFFAATTADRLPERERLLLAMADVTPQLRAGVEKVASDTGVPLAPLYGALLDAGLDKLTVEDRDKKLAEAASAYAETQEKLKTLASTDPEVTRLRGEAEKSMALGALVEAEAHLDAAIAVDRKSRLALKEGFVERTLSEAASLNAKAGVARTALNYAVAIAALEEAAALHADIAALDIPDATRRDRVRLLGEIGDLQVLVGNTAKAFEAYQRTQAAAEARIAKAPGEPYAERDLSISHAKIGDMRVAQGNLADGLAAYEAGLAISERLAAANPGNIEWQRDLSISHGNIGDVQAAQGHLISALTAYEAGLAILERLATTDPSNSEWQRGLSLSHDEIGDVRVKQGNLAGALAAYEAGLAIHERLAATDPSNSPWQRDLSIGHDKIGDVRVAQGNLAGALAAYEAGLTIAERLAAGDHGNSQWQRDLSISHDRIGNVRVLQGNLSGALTAYQAALTIAERLASGDPSNSRWQRDLIVSHYKLAQAGADAKLHLNRALEIALDMEAKGTLVPADAFIPGALREELAKLGAQ